MKANTLVNGCTWEMLAVCLLAGVAAGCDGGGRAAAAEQDHAAANTEDAQPVGIELGQFDVREHHPIEGHQSTLRFTLYATVDQAEIKRFQRLLRHRQHKIRDEVVTAARVLSFNELDDPQLARLERRILLRLERALPELAIRRIYVTDFRLAFD